MSVVLDQGFRVQVTSRRDGTVADREVTGLSYESGLPGGFKSCTFVVPASAPAVEYLDDVRVMFADEIVWEGQVEEISPGDVTVTVTCLGYSATLKRDPSGHLFIDRGFGRWQTQSPQEIPTHWTGISINAPVLDGVVGATGQLAATAQEFPAGDIGGNTGFEIAYVPPHGTVVRSFRFRVSENLLTPPASAAVSAVRVWGTYSTSTDTNSFGDFSIAWDGGNDPVVNKFSSGGTTETTPGEKEYRFPESSSSGSTIPPFVGFLIVWSNGNFATWTPAADQLFVWYDQRITGEIHPDTGERLLEDDLVVDVMIRAALAKARVDRVSLSDEAMTPGRYVIRQAVFEHVTVEEVTQALVDVVGWEWGVFAGGRLHVGPRETVTALGYRSTEVFDTPPWYLSVRQEDGHRIDVTRSAANVVNEVTVRGTSETTGIRYAVTVQNFTDPRCPLNRPGGGEPLEVRAVVLDAPVGVGVSEFAEYAASYLERYAAPLVTGEVRISMPVVARVDAGSTSPFIIDVSGIGLGDTIGGRDVSADTTVHAPAILPGYWCHFPDIPSTGAPPAPSDTGGAPPGGVAMIRYVRVDADTAGAQVTLTLDDGSTRFDTQLAALAEGRRI